MATLAVVECRGALRPLPLLASRRPNIADEGCVAVVFAESGKPNGVTHKLLQGDDPNQIARRFARDVLRGLPLQPVCPAVEY
jgi:hypothetical protein